MRDAGGAAAGGGARLREAAPRACGRAAQRLRRGSLGLHPQPAPPLSPCQCCRPRKAARGAGPARSGRAGGTTGVSQLPAVGCQGHRALRPLPHLLTHRRSLRALSPRLTGGQHVRLFRGALRSGVHRMRNRTVPDVLPARSESCLGGWLAVCPRAL